MIWDNSCTLPENLVPMMHVTPNRHNISERDKLQAPYKLAPQPLDQTSLNLRRWIMSIMGLGHCKSWPWQTSKDWVVHLLCTYTWIYCELGKCIEFAFSDFHVASYWPFICMHRWLLVVGFLGLFCISLQCGLWPLFTELQGPICSLYLLLWAEKPIPVWNPKNGLEQGVFQLKKVLFIFIL